MREYLDLANNPLFVKHIRSRLRRAALLPALIIVGFLSIGIVVLDERVFKDNLGPDPLAGVQMFFYLQCMILFLLGGSQVATAVSHINDSGIIDFHRVTPMPPKVQTLGILLGAPIRELILFSATLPFSLYCAMAGPVGITNWCKLLLVQLGVALMYFTLAMITGMSAHSKKGASGRFVAMIGVLNLLSANMLYPFGIYGPTLLTVVPVFEDVVTRTKHEDQKKFIQQNPALQPGFQGGGAGMPPPKRPGAAGPQPGVQQQPGGGQGGQQGRQRGRRGPLDDETREVTFYSFKIPVVLQSLLFQGTFVGFFFIAAARRMRSSRLPLYSKPIALLFYGSIAVLTFGSVWDGPQMLRVLGLVYFLTLCGIFLISTVTPPLGEIVKGVQRAYKMTKSHVPNWSDHSSNKVLALLFGVVLAAVALPSIYIQPANVGELPQFMRQPDNFAPELSVLVAVLTLLYFAFGSQYCGIAAGPRGKSYLSGIIVAVWIFPLMIGGLVSSNNDTAGTVVMAVSPITGIANAGCVSIGMADPQSVQLAAIVPAALLAIVFFVLLFNEERKVRARIDSEHSPHKRRKDHPDEE